MRRTTTSIAAVALLIGVGSSAHATGGILGLSGGVNLWSHDPSGTFSSSELDLEDDLGLEGERETHIWFQWSHIVPVVPKLRLERVGLRQEGSGEISATYGGITANTEVDSVIDLDQTDVTLYWTPLPLPFIDIDVGVTGKHIDGEISVSESGGTDEGESFSEWLPMLYVRGAIDIPFTRFRIEGSMKKLSFDENSITDTQAMLAYKLWYAGAMVGYRQLSLNLDDFIDAEFSGPYAGAFLRF